ncbi:transposon TX1 putative protein, partial [Trifolium medium]|nr:transposon TX1 putative protein [Trifolium medium]
YVENGVWRGFVVCFGRLQFGERHLRKKGVVQNPTGGSFLEMLKFDTFLGDLNLVMTLIGRNFTWFHPNGVAMSRLDRVLLSNSWFDVWGAPNVWVLSRDVSDHCPLVLRYSSSDWGPKPFRFNNFWLQNSEFKEVIKNAWESQRVEGWMEFILKERLKGLKVIIKEWNVATYGLVEQKKKWLIKEISFLDRKSEISSLEDAEMVERKKLFEELWIILKNIDAMTFQRSRSKWLKEGDSNSRYFHSCINGMKWMNSLVALRTPTSWAEEPTQVREAVVSYFSNHFTSEGWQRPTLDGIDFSQGG